MPDRDYPIAPVRSHDTVDRNAPLVPSHRVGGIRPVPSSNRQGTIGPVNPIGARIEEVLGSLREQPLSRLLDLVGMSPVTHAEDVFTRGRDPLEAIGPDVAGLPFAAIRKGKPVYRGAANWRETLDPAYYDRSDLLGHYTHFAEGPSYANKYAGEWNIADDPEIYGEPLKTPLTRASSPNVRPAMIINRNTLDFIEPDPDDMLLLASHIKSTPERKHFMSKLSSDTLAPYDNSSKAMHLRSVGRELAEYITRRDRDLAERAGFDAIRYADGIHPSWAIPESTLNLAVTPWGTPINKDPIGPSVDVLESK